MEIENINSIVLNLLNQLIDSTKNSRIKWSDGSQPNEFFTPLEKITILFSYFSEKEQYRISVMDERGNTQFEKTISLDNSELIDSARSLYEAIVANSKNSVKIINNVIDLVKKK